MNTPTPTLPTNPIEPGLARNDFLLLAACCLAFFGFSLVGGRPLTMHEGVLPQSAREMLADHDFVVPKNGGRPWLESPPLPQWTTVALYSLFGSGDQLWVARIGPALMGTLSVLLLAWMAGRLFGRTIGLLSGGVFATMYELVQYSWLAEDEIFLCALVTLAVSAFVWVEYVRADSAAPGSRNFFGARPWSLLLFFLALGATNLAKGIAFGTVMAAVSMATTLLWNRDFRRISFYCWFWGWLAYGAVALAWPLAAWLRYPDVVNVWFFDHMGRLDGDYQAITKPLWYYAKTLPGEIAPWTLIAPLGLWLTARTAFGERYSPWRFVWCWAIATPVVFSLPQGKNHHYLLHCIAPWGMLSAVALVWLHKKITTQPAIKPWVGPTVAAAVAATALIVVRHKLPDPWLFPTLLTVVPTTLAAAVWAVAQPRPRFAAGALFGVIALGFCGGHWYAGAYADLCRDDTAFLAKVRQIAKPDDQVFVDTKLGSLDEFRILYYLDGRTKALHNLSFLADSQIAKPQVLVVARASAESQLEPFGDVELVAQSAKTRREKSPADRFTLFRLTYRPDRPRVSTAAVRISPMQVMQREEGPFLR